jgi:hypothetical protein
MAKKEVFYRQCRYEREEEKDGKIVTSWNVAWLPEHLCRVGKTFFFRADEEETLWTVTSVGTSRQKESERKEKERAQRNYRANTDI